jgi:hypothetical protein
MRRYRPRTLRREGRLGWSPLAVRFPWTPGQGTAASCRRCSRPRRTGYLSSLTMASRHGCSLSPRQAQGGTGSLRDQRRALASRNDAGVPIGLEQPSDAYQQLDQVCRDRFVEAESGSYWGPEAADDAVCRHPMRVPHSLSGRALVSRLPRCRSRAAGRMTPPEMNRSLLCGATD